MKIEKYADSIKGRTGSIKTSGGGNFNGYIGGYDKESNTIDVYEGNSWIPTKIDTDKIVSVKSTNTTFITVLFIIAWIIGMFLLLNITGSKNKYNRYYQGDSYERRY